MKFFPRGLKALAPVALLMPMAAFAVSAVTEDVLPGPPKPLLEIGVIAGGAYVPDYPGASHSQATGLVLPSLIYRGEFLRSDQEGVRGEVALSRRWEFSLGVDASFAADSSDNPQRRGLPNLDYLIEAGPAVEYRIAAYGAREFSAGLQLRAGFAVDTDRFDYVGYALEPQLVYRDRRLFQGPVQFTAILSSKFGFDGLNDYFYTVNPDQIAPGRPAFDADDGYQQTAVSLAEYYPVTPRVSLFAAQQLQFTGGAVNDDSPLYRKDFNYAVGFGIAYSLYLSERTTADR